MKNRFFYADRWILGIMFILNIISFIMIYSSWSVTAVVFGEATVTSIILKQLLFIFLATIMFVIISLINYKVFKQLSYLIWLIVVVLLVVVFFMPEINESHSWIPLGFINFQPSEFAKIAIILAVSNYYDRLFKKGVSLNIKNAFLKPGFFIAVPLILIILQPDPGTALIIIIFSLAMLMFSGLKFRYVIASLVSLVLLISVVSLAVIAVDSLFNTGFVDKISSKQVRMLNRFDYEDPCGDFQGDGFQVCNSLIAINSGGLTGKGLGKSTQKYLYLPESHTDTIFAVTAEEFGFIGTVFILILYFLLVIRVLAIGKRANNRYSMLVCVGVAFLLLAHIFINIGGITNLIPFTGLPLPLFSYGGTFLLTVFIALGLVQSIAIKTNMGEE